MNVRVERAGLTTHFLLRSGSYVRGLTFRDVLALYACRHGAARWRDSYIRHPYLSWHGVEAEVEAYGVGRGTISNLCSGWPPGTALIVPGEEPGPIVLTPLGDAALDAILRLPGIEVA